jgi:hypothetical protein
MASPHFEVTPAQEEGVFFFFFVDMLIVACSYLAREVCVADCSSQRQCGSFV